MQRTQYFEEKCSVRSHAWYNINKVFFSCNCLEGDVECFSEYMELWIHRMRFEGLRLWLSAMLRIQGEIDVQYKGCFFHKGASMLLQSNEKKHSGII